MKDKISRCKYVWILSTLLASTVYAAGVDPSLTTPDEQSKQRQLGACFLLWLCWILVLNGYIVEAIFRNTFQLYLYQLFSTALLLFIFIIKSIFRRRVLLWELLVSPLGGHQGDQGQMDLLGIQFDYAAGSFWDKLAEAYSGTHDTLNSLIWYDELGNGKNLGGTLLGKIGDITNITNVPVATPFAYSVLLPPEVWNAVFALIKSKN